eukprot:scaffold23933_cov119-Isochrysis_galbana.AAC.9
MPIAARRSRRTHISMGRGSRTLHKSVAASLSRACGVLSEGHHSGVSPANSLPFRTHPFIPSAVEAPALNALVRSRAYMRVRVHVCSLVVPHELLQEPLVSFLVLAAKRSLARLSRCVSLGAEFTA